MKIGYFIALLLVSLLLGVAGIFFFLFLGPAKSWEEERFIVPLNSREEQTVTALKEKGFLKSPRIFQLVLEFICWQKKDCPEPGQRIAPGGYLLSKSMNAYELAQALAAGPYQKWVLIPPGKRKEQTAVILQKVLGWSDGIAQGFILAAEEGYLFPDTYLVDVDADPAEVISRLRVNFNEKFDAQLQKDLLAQNVRNDTALKIASLIERESGGETDKPIIAGIIWNRLNKGMRLEIDATVQYAMVTEDLKQKTTDPDNFNFWPFLPAGVVRKISSLYNTYLHEGLPPGPICSPGLAAIKAAVYPAETEAFYYLHSADKQIHTAKTYKEHQENIEKYLK